MQLLVGLGNPGDKYRRNRHNIGFLAVEEIASRHGFPPFREKFKGLIGEGTIGGEKVLILKPQTFMNSSGESIEAAAQFYKIPPEDITVVYDELDLVPGKARIKVGGGNGGHNGLRSIDPRLGTNYRRVRLGIGHPGHKDAVMPWVLGDFSKADLVWLEPLLGTLADNAELLAQARRQYADEQARHRGQRRPRRPRRTAPKPPTPLARKPPPKATSAPPARRLRRQKSPKAAPWPRCWPRSSGKRRRKKTSSQVALPHRGEGSAARTVRSVAKLGAGSRMLGTAVRTPPPRDPPKH